SGLQRGGPWIFLGAQGQGLFQDFCVPVLQVAVVDLNKTVGEQCQAQLDAEFGEGRSVFIQCDVTHGDALRDAFQRTVDQFGRLDIVINNAGINNEKNWEKTIQVNLTSVIKGTYLALEHMSKEYGKQGGTIINVSSMAAFLHSPHQPVYTATKHGVIGFTRAMAVSGAQRSVSRVLNATLPVCSLTPQCLKSGQIFPFQHFLLAEGCRRSSDPVPAARAKQQKSQSNQFRRSSGNQRSLLYRSDRLTRFYRV
uniref:Uncharacterized protein n=1 Tax=Xiphophorus couchianus TaxID=32473 RepID=A0A3B5M0W0_9TELE